MREAIVSRMIGICIFYNGYVENTMHLFHYRGKILRMIL